MRFESLVGSVVEVPCDLLVLCASAESWSEDLLAVNERLGGLLRRAASEERFESKLGQRLLLHTHGQLGAQRVAVLGAMDPGGIGPGDLRGLGGRAARTAVAVAARHVTMSLGGELGSPAACQLVAEGLLLGTYRFDAHRTKSEPRPGPEVVHFAAGSVVGGLSAAFARAEAVATAVRRARDLVNEPPGGMTPTRLADEATSVAGAAGMEVRILGPDECRERGMGMLLAVGRGSAEPIRFIHMTHRPPNARRRIGLVGKGVTFDSGGLSLKPTDGMLNMKMDMAGAAAVISSMSAIAKLGLPIEVHALAPCTENMVSGAAYRIGDVLRAMNGKTVEVTNTDAEGRLALGDALSYAQTLDLDEVFDFATLTGACMIALGPSIAGVMSNRAELASSWVAASERAGEAMWPLPLPRSLRKVLESNVADLKNAGKREGGALSAGLFLQEFVGEGTPWAHIDLAGPAWSEEDDDAVLTKGGTGFGVSTIVEYLATRPVPD